MVQRLDLIIFGASGFTGKYSVEELNRIGKLHPGLTWGIAGRSQSKLDKIIKELQEKTGDNLSKIRTFIADVSDGESLTKMTRHAQVLVNCCGPYRFYGEPLVKACIETNTHHVDVSGEPAYMERMQLEYNEAAQKAGVYIVSACGFDSIPADMGIVYLQQQFKGQINSVECYIRTELSSKFRSFGEAVIHYGTWESLVYGIASRSELGPLRKKLYSEKLPSFSPRLASKGIVHKSEIDNGWYLPFPGADPSVVYRSQRFFYENKEQTRPAQMKAYFGFPSIFPLIFLCMVSVFIGILSYFSFGRKLLLTHPKIFTFGAVSHEGPSEIAMKNTKFWLNIYGEGWDETVKDTDGKKPNKSIQVKVAGYNPGYGATCTALLFAGITILKEANKMPGNGGVLSPGAAFSKTSLIENLNKNNLTFEVIKTADINE